MDMNDPLKVTAHLYADMIRRRPMIAKATRYYDGDHDLAFASEKFLEAFGGLFRAFADNWCPLVIGAVEERLGVVGFRVNPNGDADDAAHEIWQRNEMDLQSQIGHTEGLVQGAHYATAWIDDEDETKAKLTVESALDANVLCHPKIRSRRLAGLRCWLDDDGYEHVEVFIETGDAKGRVYLFRSRARREGVALSAPERVQWIPEDHPDLVDKLDSSSSMPNPFGVVPIVEFLNKPRLSVSKRAGFGAHSELGPIMPLQDAANKVFADLLVASEFAAYPQRWVTGWEPDTDDETDEVIPPRFRSGPGHTWWTENAEAAFGAFEAASVDGYVKLIEMIVQHIASISSTPPHYLRASADRLSGESLRSAETGLVSKVRRKQQSLGAGWEELMRIAGAIEGNETLRGAVRMETIWRDPETRTESEHVDAVSKRKDLGVPLEQLWSDLGYTPEQIKRFPAMRARSDIETAAAVAAERDARVPPAPAPAPPEVNPAEV